MSIHGASISMTDRQRFPPGPPGRFLIGNFPLGSRDPLRLFSDWARRYGDVFHYRAFHIHVFFINHPDAIESVLVTHSRDFIKGRGLQANRRLFGDGLLTSEGDFWLRQRRLCQPSFHRERVESYASLMVSYTERMIESWPEGQERDLEADMRQLTLEIVAKALFGVEIGDQTREVARALKPVMDFNSSGRILMPLMRFLPAPRNVRYRLAVRRLDRIVWGIIRERLGSEGNEDDLLSSLLAARGENGERMSPKQLRDEVMTLLLAGHETTSLALCWTFYLLARHPAVERKLVEEIKTVVGEQSPAPADLTKLVYAAQVLKESLRLYPPAYAMARIALRDCEIGGYNVPRGTSVVMSPWITHRDPRFFHNPDAFEPERWTEEFARRLPRFAYFPFGGGPRICIGAGFATTEATLLMVTILRRFHLELKSQREVVPAPAITLRPKGGIRVIPWRQPRWRQY
ncbi:MAG: cytochrome P450 [Terriglobia bacterium]